MTVCVCSPGEEDREDRAAAPLAGGTPAGGRAPDGGAAAPASSVTRHGEKPKGHGTPSRWEYLSHGVDTLDLGVGVVWERDWEGTLARLAAGKKAASGKDAVPWEDLPSGESWIMAGGRSGYPFHLRTHFGELYFAKSASPSNTPNVYVSLRALVIWQYGIAHCLRSLGRDVRHLGGRLVRISPSRCDLCVDARVPEGLSYNFLREHLVSHTRNIRQFENDGKLGTFYLGDPKSPVQLRIYNKGRKAFEDQTYILFQQVWHTKDLRNIWRFEYQMRRQFLREHRINTLGGLFAKLGSIWAYLTGDWCSLREGSDSHRSRRPVHPGWAMLQGCAERFGQVGDLSRSSGPCERATPEWHLAHIAGCATSYGALRGFDRWEETLRDLWRALDKRKSSSEYDEEIRCKKARRGRSALIFEGDYPGGWDEA